MPSVDDVLCILFWMSILFAAISWGTSDRGQSWGFWLLCAIAIRGYY